MSSAAIGIVLALGAAVALNAGYLLQHAGAGGAPVVTPRRPLASLGGLLRSRMWLAGTAGGTAGWAMHIGALAHAPLSLVQAFVAGGMALSAPVATRALGHRLSRGEQAGIVFTALALVLLAVGMRGVRSPVFDPAALGVYLVGAACVAVGVAALAVRARSAPVLGLAGGILYGAADTAIKALTASHPHLPGLLVSPWTMAAAAATVGAFFCFQRGLQLGRALPVIALMTAATNLVSIAGGLAVFHDRLGATQALAAVHACALVLVLVAAALLAPSQAALVEPVGART